MGLVAICAVAWVTGLAAFIVCLAVFWQQTVSRGDLLAILFWSAFATACGVAIAYAPALFALRRFTRRTAPAWLYILVSMALGSLPVLFITAVQRGNLRSLRSPEAVLFHFMFGAFGFMFGNGFFRRYGRKNS